MEYFLNEKQKEAVSYFKGPMLVLAGPGSGKTTVVTHRVKYLIENYSVIPSSILVITFTKAAANEMKERFNAMNVLGGERVTFCTFHALFFRILRVYCGYTLDSILNEEEKWNYLKNMLSESEIETDDEESYINDFLTETMLMKNELMDIHNYTASSMPDDDFKYMYKKYENYKARNEKIDFDDMIYICHKVLLENKEVLEMWQNRYKYILIDEFQDINKGQYECIKMIAQPENNVFAVGDDDQSIYSFRGARPDFILDFPKSFNGAKKVVLDINYRSTDSIIKLSERIIKNNKNRYEKEIKGTDKKGKIAILLKPENPTEEAEIISEKIQKLNEKGIPLGEIAVIYRTNMQGSNFARCFGDKNIPYNLKDSILNIYEHFIARDIISYMRFSEDITRNSDFIRIMNKPKRYISRDTISEAQKLSGPLIKTLYQIPTLKTFQEKRIDELLSHIYQIRKRKPYEAVKYIRNIVAYDDYLQDYADYRKTNILALREIADEITEAAKDKETFQEFFDYIDELSNRLKDDKNKTGKSIENAVTLSTMHSAKGLEFDTVFIPSVVEDIVPHEKSSTPQEIEEERRLFYVGVTRAKNRLYISEIVERHDKKMKRSRFIKELGVK